MSRYDPASGTCAGHSQPGAVALMRWCLDTYPEASNLGIYVCRAVRGATRKSVHADGRADDVAFPMPAARTANPRGREMVARLVAKADPLGVQLIIYDQQIWTSRTRRWEPHCRHPGATGPHGACSGPHFDHAHIELLWATSRDLPLTVTRIASILDPGDDMFDDDDRALLSRIHHEVAGGDTKPATVVQMLEEILKRLAALEAKD